jgi:hypothetical protein
MRLNEKRKSKNQGVRISCLKALDEEAVRLAVTAHVRHAETDYDELLLNGIERRAAREKVYSKLSKRTRLGIFTN